LESLATFLRERTQDIPTFGSFLATVGTALLGIALGAFFARNTAPVRFLRDRLERLLGGLVAALLLAMVFLSMLQIVLRNVFDSGFLWIDPLLNAPPYPSRNGGEAQVDRRRARHQPVAEGRA
jgi:hypothetical protein